VGCPRQGWHTHKLTRGRADLSCPVCFCARLLSWLPCVLQRGHVLVSTCAARDTQGTVTSGYRRRQCHPSIGAQRDPPQRPHQSIRLPSLGRCGRRAQAHAHESPPMPSGRDGLCRPRCYHAYPNYGDDASHLTNEHHDCCVSQLLLLPLMLLPRKAPDAHVVGQGDGQHPRPSYSVVRRHATSEDCTRLFACSRGRPPSLRSRTSVTRRRTRPPSAQAWQPWTRIAT
jgi:hypothetical protein